MSDPQTPDEILDHYTNADEAARLCSGPDGTMEAIRTLELLDRLLPSAPARILDAGGGPGFYARRLTLQGYSVHLIDPVPRHIEEASRTTEEGPAPETASLGDARSIEHESNSFDAVLLLGPLYHLTERADRMTALAEARRVLRSGGVAAAAGITRFASAIDGLDRGFIDDPGFVEIVHRDLDEGQHRNPTNTPGYFTTAFFHHPEELRAEMIEAGFADVEVYAIEGVSWAASDLADRLADLDKREIVLEIIRRTETEPALLGASPHFLAVGRA